MQIPLILAPLAFSVQYVSPVPLFLQKHVGRKQKKIITYWSLQI